MNNGTYKIKSCKCLQGCSEVKYKFFIGSNRKFTEDEVEEICQDTKPHWIYVYQEQEAIAEHKQMKNLTALDNDVAIETCKQYIKNEYAHVRVRIDGSSFMRHSAGLTYSTSDKFALVGGTVGLFSGFSVLVIIEVIHWLVILIKRAFYPEAAAAIDPEEEDPVQKQFEVMKKEMDALKAEMAKLKEAPMKKENIPAPKEPPTTIVVTEME